MRTLETHIDIHATPARIWSILMDFGRYAEWNPFIPTMEGKPIVGTRLRARLVPPGQKGMIFTPTVLAADSEREFRWIGKLLIRGLFDGEHSFKIESLGDRCRFHQSERFTGILVPLFAALGLFAATERGFAAMNGALKQRAEAQAR